jgi:Conserved oligomeric complex COG6
MNGKCSIVLRRPVAQATSPYTPRIRRQQVKTRQSIVTLFLARFTLSPNEAEALSSPEIPVGPRFFAAMDRAQAIRDDCRVLMAGEDSPSKAGFVSCLPIYTRIIQP